MFPGIKVEIDLRSINLSGTLHTIHEAIFDLRAGNGAVKAMRVLVVTSYPGEKLPLQKAMLE